MDTIDKLNEEFAVNSQLEFKEGPGGLIYAEITNEGTRAQIYLHGAQLTSFTPNGGEDVIYLSPRSRFEPGIAIRGGIPISWPWFADHPTDKSKPAHGFARTSPWHVRETKKISDSETELRLGLTNGNDTLKLFERRFYLEAIFNIGSQLDIKLRTINIDVTDFTISSAFHSYYKVSDVSAVSVNGLDETEYIDKVDDFTTKMQEGPVQNSGETDRIYVDTETECVIEDPGLGRSIHVTKSGSKSTVVWNPWEKKSEEMKDLGAGEYRSFVCVETANAGEDTITIAPGEKHVLRVHVRAESS